MCSDWKIAAYSVDVWERGCAKMANRIWHIRDLARSQIEVRFWCKSGHTAGIAAMTGFDLQPT
jgi:hypothetical protein